MSFTIAQVVLLALIAGLVVYSFAGRSVSRDRTLLLILAVLGGVLVLWPGLSTSVARALGVGRGADLVFYLFVVFCLFRFVSIAGDRRRMDERLTGVVRELALLTARPATDDGRVAPAELSAEHRPGAPAGDD
jgi:hypothetical protein